MEALAKVVLQALSFLELSEDETVNREAALENMEAMVATLKSATSEELEALKRAVAEECNLQNGLEASEEVIDFYENFFDHFGLE